MIFLPPAVNAKCWVNSKYRRALETEFQERGVQVCPYYYLMQTALGLETASKENTCFFFSAWHAKQTVVGLSVFYSCEAERWVSPSFTATVLNTAPKCEHRTCPVPPELESLGTSCGVQGFWPSLPVRQCFAAFIATTTFLSPCSEGSYTLFQLAPCVNPLFCYF